MAKKKKYPEIEPGEKRFKTIVVRIVLFILGRGFQAAAALDPDIKKEISGWKDPFYIMIKVLPDGPRLAFEKRNNRIKSLGSREVDADIESSYKNIDSAFMNMTAQISFPQSFAENRLSVKGDLAVSMSFVRCLNIVQAYLFPKIIAKLVLKRVPKLTFRKLINRILIYTLAIPFGIIK